MADKKISQLTALSAANLAPSTDVLAIVDTSATETKKIVAQDLINGVLNVASAVGIGTASPSYKLHVAATANDAGLFTSTATTTALRLDNTNANGWGSNLAIYTGGTAAGYFGTLGSLAGTTSQQIAVWSTSGNGIGFYTNGSSTAKAVIDSSGNLGIGTASPGSKLTVSGDIQILSTNYLSFSNTAQQTYIRASASNTLAFGTNSTQAMTLDASGNLGVGITSPTARLHLKGPAGSNPNTNGVVFQASGSTSNFGAIGLDNSSGDFVVASGSGAALRFYTNSDLATTNERGRFTAGGDLLVGTTSSSASANAGAKIYPAGTMRCVNADSTNSTENWSMYSTGAANYRFYVGWGGTVYATNTTISGISDQRYKENIRDLDVGLDAILALKPRKFDWKEGKGKDIKDDRGFIAQEFEQVFPDLVDEWKDPAPEGEEPYKSVRQDLIPVLVKAIQEQQAMIKSLEAKVSALEAK